MNIADLKTEYDRIVEILKGVADGSKEIENDPVWCYDGLVTIYVNCYAIVFYIECGELDHVRNVVTSNGIEIDFWDFDKVFDNPIKELTEIEICNLEAIIHKGVKDV